MAGRVNIDWLDIGLHTAIAGLIVPLAHYGFDIPVFGMVLANVILWPARELWQHRPDYGHIFTHEQSLLEWLTPAAVSIIVAFLIPAPAQAAVCGNLAGMQRQLNIKYQETLVAAAMAADNLVMIGFYVSPRGSFTVLATYPDGRTCIIVAGKNYVAMKPEIPGEKS